MHSSIFFHTLLILFLACLSLQGQTSAMGEKQANDIIPASAEAVNPLKKGSKIPSVTLTAPEGKPFDLKAFVKEQPTVLIFYRGGWCPYCNLQLGELMEADPELRRLGYEILAISPDTPEKLSESMEKHNMSYKLLSDSSMAAAKAFGVAYQVSESTVKRYQENGIRLVKGAGEGEYMLPVPSVFIIDPQGTIRYVYFNADYKTRIKTEELLQQAKEVQRKKKP